MEFAQEAFQKLLKKDTTATVSTGVHCIAVDGSEHSDRAFEWAHRDTPKTDTFYIVHGISNPGFTHYASMQDKKLEEHEKIMQRYMTKCQEAGRKCDFGTLTYATSNDFGLGICDEARKANAKDIIMGRRGLTGARAVLGSMSSSVLSLCDYAVTLVKKETPLKEEPPKKT